MAEEEKDPERSLRIDAMVQRFQEATEAQGIGEVQIAVANFVALMSVKQGDKSEAVLLTTIEAISEVYRSVREHVKAGKKPEIVN